MTLRPEFPAPVLQVLAALWEQPTRWQDSATLARQTGLPPERLQATMRFLAARGLTQVTQPGKAHLGQLGGERYRLTADGLARAVIALAGAVPPAG